MKATFFSLAFLLALASAAAVPGNDPNQSPNGGSPQPLPPCPHQAGQGGGQPCDPKAPYQPFPTDDGIEQPGKADQPSDSKFKVPGPNGSDGTGRASAQDDSSPCGGVARRGLRFGTRQAQGCDSTSGSAPNDSGNDSPDSSDDSSTPDASSTPDTTASDSTGTQGDE